MARRASCNENIAITRKALVGVALPNVRAVKTPPQWVQIWTKNGGKHRGRPLREARTELSTPASSRRFRRGCGGIPKIRAKSATGGVLRDALAALSEKTGTLATKSCRRQPWQRFADELAVEQRAWHQRLGRHHARTREITSRGHMTDDRSLREKVADAARATADIRRHVEHLTNEAFAAAEQQRRIEEAMRENADQSLRMVGPGWRQSDPGPVSALGRSGRAPPRRVGRILTQLGQ
jgi:hypothetical protein